MRVQIETTEQVIEGEIVDGVPLDDGEGFDLDAYFTVREDDDTLVKVMGWLVTVQLIDERLAA